MGDTRQAGGPEVKCLKCRNPTLPQVVCGRGYRACLRCHWLCWQITTLEQVVTPRFAESLKGHMERVWPTDAQTCPSCSSSFKRISLRDIQRPERDSNLKLFPSYRPWLEEHRKGPVELLYCESCSSVWHNSRTACSLPIDWDQREGEYLEARRAKANSDPLTLSDNLNENIATLLFGIPYIENIPSFADVPYACLIVAGVVTASTIHAFSNDLYSALMMFDPSRKGLLLVGNLFSYSLIHGSWGHWLGNVGVFMLFGPLVEREMTFASFVLLIGFGSLGGALAQAAMSDVPMIGFSCCVTAVIAFFCLRFPKAVIAVWARGFIWRFKAPSALAIYAAVNLATALDPRSHVAVWGHLGGMLAGFLLHVTLPRGAASEAYVLMERGDAQRALNPRNWRDAG